MLFTYLLKWFVLFTDKLNHTSCAICHGRFLPLWQDTGHNGRMVSPQKRISLCLSSFSHQDINQEIREPTPEQHVQTIWATYEGYRVTQCDLKTSILLNSSSFEMKIHPPYQTSKVWDWFPKLVVDGLFMPAASLVDSAGGEKKGKKIVSSLVGFQPNNPSQKYTRIWVRKGLTT